MRFSFLWGWCGLKATTKTGIFLAWGGVSFIDTWPNINSVCDLPGLFWGNVWCWEGFVGVHCYFFGGGGGGLVVVVFVVVVVVFLIVVVVLLVWLLLFLGLLLLSCSFCLFLLLLLFSCFLFLLVTAHPKEKTKPTFVFQCFGGPLSPFSLFCSCLLIFLVVSHLLFSFLIGISRCCLHGCAKTTR